MRVETIQAAPRDYHIRGVILAKRNARDSLPQLDRALKDGGNERGQIGTLWKGRYKSSLVQHDDCLLACYRYIELNPIRARMTVAPEDHRWSSCRARLGYEAADWLDLDPSYLALDETDPHGDSDRDYLQVSIPPGEWELIREAVQRGQLTGNDRFTQEVERRGRGRPVKATGVEEETGLYRGID